MSEKAMLKNDLSSKKTLCNRDALQYSIFNTECLTLDRVLKTFSVRNMCFVQENGVVAYFI